MGICFSSDGWADLEPAGNGGAAASAAPAAAPAAAAGAGAAAAGAAAGGWLGASKLAAMPPAAPMKPMSPSDYYAGVNCYYLMTRGASEGTQQMVLDTLDGIKRLGFSVIRIWAFNDGSGWNALQTAPGMYDENVFRGLDWVLAQCAARGLRLMMTLTNFWEDFGGLPQYVRWSKGLGPGDPAKGEDFYADPVANQMYRRYVAAVINRVNTFTGAAYRDDPTIHSWDLINEPRNEGDATFATLTRWIDSTAAYVKSLDPNHPVTVGLEGFFGPSTPELAAGCNPYNQTHGVDWAANNASPHVDFCSIHLYGDQWLPADSSDAARASWAVDWVKGHVRAASDLGKPLCLQEFGKRPAGRARTKLFKKLLSISEDQANTGGPLTGTLVWMYAHESYPDYDGYTVYESGEATAEAAKQGQQPAVSDAETTELLAAFAQSMPAPRPS